ncbi:uncharacterized protein LOC111630539 [Centruroides sculpturatus]|uniref:uncharacterized protein LOC111630539 n=1 Tax=Centruroides sculpturatus TaxID=218467 RepID=UPI000C6F0115|nr:uncharacterized protein LOC111630539 [Centruroides sculpturatus]
MPINSNENGERLKEDIFEEQDKQIIKTTEETIKSNSKDQRKRSEKLKEEQITESLNEKVVEEETTFQTPKAITSIKQDAELPKSEKHKKTNGKKKREYYATILLGVTYLTECPAQNKVPIFLIIGGIGLFIETILFATNRFIENFKKRKTYLKIPLITLLIFLLSWFILGCVWVYKMYPPVYDDKYDKQYCNKKLYLFTLWMINSVFISAIVYIGLVCFVTTILMIFVHKKEIIS